MKTVDGRKDAGGSVRIDVYQQDWMPGFAAFLDDGSVQSGATAKVGLNVGALMAAVETKDLQPSDVPYVVAETIMHEVMHALEAWAGVEFNEQRIEALISKYRGGVTQWTECGGSNADDAGSSPATPASTSNANDLCQQILDAINILDGNDDPIDWRDGSHPELLRKLCEHLEAFDLRHGLHSANASRQARTVAICPECGCSAIESKGETA